MGNGRASVLASPVPQAETRRRLVGSLALPNYPTAATGQFQIADERSSQEVADLIRQLGYEPVWKDWDAALTA